jgi:hypothetical protein
MRGQGNIHNVFNNSRRAFGLTANDRLRVLSHGPPLRNINGDSQSLIEEDGYDNGIGLMNNPRPNLALSRLA